MKKVLSPSQVSTLSECERKWAWKYLAGIPDEPNLGADLGTRVHEILAEFLEHGTAIDIAEVWVWPHDQYKRKYYPGAIARTMINKELPKPRDPRVQIEYKFTWTCHHGINWRGTKDIRFVTDQRARITDHKTSSDPRKYGHTPETLKRDFQGIIYPLSEGKKQHYSCLWNYGGRTAKAKDAFTVHQFWLTQDSLKQAYDAHVLPVAKRTLQLYKEQPHPLDLEPTVDACSMYGGCPHRDRCDLSVEQNMGAMMARRTSRLQASLDEELDDDLDTEEEEEETPPPAAARKRKPLLADDDEDDDEDDDDEDDDEDEDDEPQPPPPKARKRRGRPPKPQADEAEAEAPPARKRRTKAAEKPKTKPKTEEPAVNPPENDEMNAEELAELIVNLLMAKLSALLLKK